jgi:hypothetical protein
MNRASQVPRHDAEEGKEEIIVEGIAAGGICWEGSILDRWVLRSLVLDRKE